MVAGAVVPLPAQGRPGRVTVPTPLVAIALSDLDFGTVLPGVPSAIDRHDRRAALFEVRGSPDASVRIDLALPSALLSTGSATLPISFSATDGFADFSRGRPPRGTVFDPHAPLIMTLGPNGRVYVRLGGTALPARPQAGGAYHATIVLTVYDLGS